MEGAHADTTAAVLAALAAAAVAAGAISLVWVHFLPTGHRAAVDAVSDYGVGPYRLFSGDVIAPFGAAPADALARGTDVRSGGLIWLGVFAVPVCYRVLPDRPRGSR